MACKREHTFLLGAFVKPRKLHPHTFGDNYYRNWSTSERTEVGMMAYMLEHIEAEY